MKSIYSLAGVVLMGFASAAWAGSIGIHFAGGDTSTMKTEDSAGATGVEQANWNNVTITSDDPNGHGNSGNKGIVHDEKGNVVKTASVSVKATDKTQLFGAGATPWGFKEGNIPLVTGVANPQPHITVKGIPYKQYNVYVYLGCGAQNGLGSVSISVPKNVKGAVDPNATYFYNFKWTEGEFVQTAALTLEDAKNGDGTNYVLFKGNTAGSIVIDCDGKLGGGWTGVAGVQIVEVPEPKPEPKAKK